MTEKNQGGLPMALHLPARAAGRAWDGAAPDPLDDRALYEGVTSRRVFAWFVDVTILVFLGFALWVVTMLVTAASLFTLSPVTIPLALLIAAFLPLLYNGYFIGKHGGTPGMALMDLEVRSWTGEQPDLAQGFLHSALFLVTVAPSTWLILVVAFMNERRRCAHDYLAGTVVIRASRLRERAGVAL
jgi:uncharacterized RDD family membrane protein YckC